MLGEAARHRRRRRPYLASTGDAIAASAPARGTRPSVFARPSISVKLSALHPRYEDAAARARARRARAAVHRARARARAARHRHHHRRGGSGTAGAVARSVRARCARSRRSPAGTASASPCRRTRSARAASSTASVALARETRTRIPVRLVKGAYWDTRDQARAGAGHAGLSGVHAQGAHRRVVPRVRAGAARGAATRVYPMFATHNAHTIAGSARARSARRRRLRVPAPARHGRRALPDRPSAARQCASRAAFTRRSAVTRDLLPYLVRRLLENGANTSFVNRIGDPTVAIDDLVADPLARAPLDGISRRQREFRCRADIFAPERHNSAGVSLADQRGDGGARRSLARSARSAMDGDAESEWSPRRQGARERARARRPTPQIGRCRCRVVERRSHVGSARRGPAPWDAQPAHERAAILERAADLLEARSAEWVALLAREAGKTRAAAIAEVREAADFCRYYAAQARQRFAAPLALPSPTGESNTLALHGRGVFACIIAVEFSARDLHRAGRRRARRGQRRRRETGRADAADRGASGRARCTRRAFRRDALALVPGPGEIVGAQLVADPRIAGVAFTGSTDVGARSHRRSRRVTPIVPLIAETGGQNAMIVDSSALPEQVVADVVASAFDSAGQRCSALRVLCLQEDIAPRVLEMIAGAMDELVDRRPGDLATDVGPVIDAAARDGARSAHRSMQAAGLVAIASLLPPACAFGTLRRADARRARPDRSPDAGVFGPVVHVVTWRADELDALIDAINASRLRPDARHPQPRRRDDRPRSSRACASATSTSTAT